MEAVAQNKEKKSSSLMYILVIGIAVVVFVFFALKGGNDDVQRKEIIVDENDIIIGERNAPVTIVEFTDFSCPYCAAANGNNQEVINSLRQRDPSWEAPLPKVIEKYVMTGKAKLVVKYYPGHKTGDDAHRVGWCLYEQLPNKFEEYKERAFAQQENTGDVDAMVDIAVLVGANKQRVEQCLVDKKYESRFSEQTLQGMNAGIKGTPTFFINGIPLEGAHSYSTFEKVIESELS